MRHSKLLILGVAGILSLNSCGENKKGEETVIPMQNDSRKMGDDHEMHAAEGENLDDGAQSGNPQFPDETIANVYEHYMHVKSALVNSNSSEAANGAEMLVETLQNSEANDEVLNAAQQIAQADELNAQRTAFSDLSAGVEEMIAGQLESGEIYKQYCPMAFEGQGGYWLSSSEEIRNPYYGDKMLKCGSVRETIQ
ncbi:DUF3347 domain-containing protein [Salinimicrobium sp. GXAS 041]|uniref:DUF3347 domain-containing protein n=1 Tax=Salinimicrobium sp. GXAS 041 TaxID=3400806 RepID=UPI003C74D663